MKCKPALQVGVSTYISKSGSKLYYSYRHVKSDWLGWVNVKEWLPYPFDLVHLKLGDKSKTGWYTGAKWDGYKLKPEDHVEAWKYKNEDE